MRVVESGVIDRRGKQPIIADDHASNAVRETPELGVAVVMAVLASVDTQIRPLMDT